MKVIARVGLISLMLLAVGCSSTSNTQDGQAQTNQYTDERDPLEGFNRDMWEFNWKTLDKHILRPAAVGYHDYVPDPVKKGLINAANNLDEPFTFFNEVLQFKLVDASITAGRFVLNSTAGIFGLIDVSGHVGIQRTNEDFGQTLAVWGAGDGAFLMLPALGPSTVKDTSGDIVDNIAFSLNLLNFPETLLKTTVQALDTRYELIDQEPLLNDSLDPYEFTKDIYLQRQDFKDYDGNVPNQDLSEDDLDALDDEDDM